MRIGITGHQRLRGSSNWEWVKNALNRLLPSLSTPLIGVTSLAVGADQLFAKAVLQHGGALEIVIPFAGYESTFSEGHDRHEYSRLLKLALKVEVLEKDGSDEEAYFSAGKRVVDLSELIFAVWNGEPAAGLGGTGDVVCYAMQQRKRIVHLNPTLEEVKEIGEQD